MTQNNLTSMNELQNYFIHQITDFVKQNNKTPIVWDDAMNDKLDPNIIVMSWRDYDGGIQAARQGHKVIMTPNRLTYLNRRQSDDPNSPGHTIITSLQTVYTFDPIPDQLTNKEASNIIGGQGCLWTEYVPEFKYVEYQLFPRMLAISDILWTTHTKDFNDLQSRIEFNSVRLKEMNVNQYLPPAPVDANSAKAIKNETAIAP